MSYAVTAGLVWREWDGEAAVYDCRRARTHLLDLGTSEVLGALAHARTPLSLEQLASLLFREEDSTSDLPVALTESERAGLKALVTMLVELALVEEHAS